jgi:hypothetical protein
MLQHLQKNAVGGVAVVLIWRTCGEQHRNQYSLQQHWSDRDWGAVVTPVCRGLPQPHPMYRRPTVALIQHWLGAAVTPVYRGLPQTLPLYMLYQYRLQWHWSNRDWVSSDPSVLWSSSASHCALNYISTGSSGIDLTDCGQRWPQSLWSSQSFPVHTTFCFTNGLSKVYFTLLLVRLACSFTLKELGSVCRVMCSAEFRPWSWYIPGLQAYP